MIELNETHDPTLSSWVAAANLEGADFPIQNLPFGVFRRRGSGEAFRGGVAIGDRIVDLAVLAVAGLLQGQALEGARACAAPALNGFMAAGPPVWSALRLALSRSLRRSSAADVRAALESALVPQDQAEYAVPCRIGDFTDFYTSIHHATAVGSIFRPDNPLLPNYKWLPVGYHGRASSVGVSGQSFPRPVGQLKAPDADEPTVGPCQRLDFELEVGIFIGPGNQPGARIDIEQAERHVFGLCLLNDWSARDVQAWEYQPLGPFLAKSFATTISPWIVTMEALAPFRSPCTRPAGDPRPLDYLNSPSNARAGGFDVALEVLLETARARQAGQPASSLARSNFRYSYWTVAQMVAHQTVNGCGLRPGDLLGSGTQSGPERSQAGSMLELNGGGRQPVVLSGGESRLFLEDGDTVILRGWCERSGAARIGFGAAAGTVLPARWPPGRPAER